MGHRGLLKQITNRQAFLGFLSVSVLLLATFASTIASADALTSMSITPSTASINAEAGSVQYEVKFTPKVTAGAFVIDFCTNTPLLGQTCDAPAGMDVSGATTATSGFAVLDTAAAMDDNTIVATKSMTADTPETVTFAALKNPTGAGAVYARVVTYAASAGAEGYVSNNPSAAAAPVDNGSVAMYFNTDVNVTGTVLETMTFCVSGSVINANCAGASTPVIRLGQETSEGSGIFALTPGEVSEGTLHTQINTNAANGVVVRLKSSAACGGLKRAGSDVCDIAAALASDVVGTDNTAKFGVKTAAATTAPGASNPIGTFQPYVADPENPAPYYLTSRFSFNYDSANPTTNGVTSTFGDPFLDTAGAPATGQNMALTFGASVSTNTPAGTYSTDLSMIAVGKF